MITVKFIPVGGVESLVDIFIIFWTLDMIKKIEKFIILHFIIFQRLQIFYHITVYHIFQNIKSLSYSVNHISNMIKVHTPKSQSPK